VKSNADGIARYVGKYLAKHVGERSERDKGARVVRFIGYRPGDRTASNVFSWNTQRGWLWRHKLKAFCKSHGQDTTDLIREIFGPRWCYYLQAEILAAHVDDCYPSESCSMLGRALEGRKLDAQVHAESAMEKAGRVANRTYLLRRVVF
jgi:hypothetical protein